MENAQVKKIVQTLQQSVEEQIKSFDQREMNLYKQLEQKEEQVSQLVQALEEAKLSKGEEADNVKAKMDL